jgi:hypothetical protein
MKAREGALDTKLAAQNAQMQDQLASLRAQIEAMGGKATDEPVKAEVVTEGRFMGHTAGDLRRYIEATSGTKVKGNPKLATLKTMAEEVASAAEINA